MDVGFSAGAAPEAGVLVVFAGPDGALSEAAARADALSDGLVRRALQLEPKGGKHGRIIDLLLPGGGRLERLLIVVVGKPEGVTALDLEELGGGIVQRLRTLQVKEATIAGTRGLELGLAPDRAARCLALGARLRGYRFDRYRSVKEGDEPAEAPRLAFLVEAPEDAGLAEVAALAEAVAHARDLVSEPANVLTPAAFADACAGLRELGVEVEILAQADLERIGMRTLLAVAQGSDQPPFVVVMRWRGSEAQPLALVGKGVCFDSGGVSIKPAGGMEDMKYDMAGAAAVMGAIEAAARRKAGANLIGVVGLVENMVSGRAQRPGDVVRSLAGKTIEVINTDAEGRLVLADLLWYTQDRFQPVAMIDLATLTGAVVVALGHEYGGLFATDEALASNLTAAGERVGEPLWRLPLGKGYERHIRSDIADIKNVGRAREAGSTAGAVFLQQFINGVPWAHLDIAGMAWTSRDLPLSPKGATGFGVRLLTAYIQSHHESP